MKNRRLHPAVLALIAFLLSAVGMTLALAAAGVYPFGSRTMTCGDMGTQYIHFFARLRQALAEHGSILYTFEAGMGSNMLPLITYYLASPLSLVIVLFPADMLAEALLLITIIKIGLSGAAYALFARHALGSDDRSALLFGTGYGLCAYAVCYATNVMWLDALVCLPLVMWGLHALVTRGRWRLLTLSLAVAFFTQFYLAYMTGLLTALALILLLVVLRPQKPWGVLLRFTGVVALAAGLAACLLVPTALRLVSDAISPAVVAGAAPLPMPSVPTLIARCFFGLFDTIQGDTPEIIGGAPVYCGTITLLLLIPYLLNSKISWQERVGALLINIFLLSGLVFRPMTFLLHAFDYAAWFQFRFSFLIVFVWLVMAHRCWLRIDGLRPWLPALVSLLALAFLQWGWPVRLSTTHPSARGLLIALLIVWPALLAVHRLRPGVRQWTSLACLLLTVGELWGSATLLIWGIDTELLFPERGMLQSYLAPRQALLNQLPRYGDEPYRAEEQPPVPLYINDNLSLDSMGFNYYSTTADRAFITYLNRLGLNSESVVARHQRSTLALDSLWGIRYVIATDAPNDYYHPVAEEGQLEAWQNDYVFPMAFLAPESMTDYAMRPLRTMTVPGGTVMLHDDIFALQNDMFRALFGEETAAVFVPLDEAAVALEALHASPTADNEAEQLVWIEGSEEMPIARYTGVATVDGPVYVYFSRAHEGGSADLIVDGQTLFSLNDSAPTGSAYIGDFAEGDAVEAMLLVDGESVTLRNARMYSLDMNALGELSDLAYAGAPLKLAWENADVTAEVEAAEGQALFASIPYDGGWHATVDGQPTPVLRAMDEFCAVRVPAGIHTVKLRYTPPGFAWGSRLSLLSLLVLGGLCLWPKKKRRGQ